MSEKYEVIEDFVGFEIEAKIGDILELKTIRGMPTLTKEGDSVCEEGSPYELLCCKKLNK